MSRHRVTIYKSGESATASCQTCGWQGFLHLGKGGMTWAVNDAMRHATETMRPVVLDMPAEARP